MKSPNSHDQRQIPISHLQPSVDAEPTSITGVVALIWPYSPSNNSFGLLLVEPDFRLRREKGQVRVQFRGSSAGAVARCGISIGDELSLSLVGVIWAKNDDIPKTPGRGIEWELQFEERLVLTGSRASKEPIFIDIDHPNPSAELDGSSSAIPQTPRPSHFTPISRLQPGTEPQKWSSPAFLKRSQLPYATYFRTQYDAAQGEGIFGDSGRTKKLRFGRNSDQWVFTDILPSPGPSDTQSREDSKSVSPAPQEAEKDRSSPCENNPHPVNITDHTLPNTNDQVRLSPVDINRSSNRSSPSQFEHTSFNSNDQHGISHVETEANPANIETPTVSVNDGDENMISPPVDPITDQPSTSGDTPDSAEVQYSAYENPSPRTDSPQQVSLEHGNHHIPNDEPTVQQKHLQNSSLDIQGDKKFDEQKIQILPPQSESLSGKVEHKPSGATDTDINTFVVQTETTKPRSYQQSPSPHLMDPDHTISRFIPQQTIHEGPISSTGQNKHEQMYDVIELSSGESEENEDIEEIEYGAIDDDQAIEEDDEDEDEEDDEEEDEDGGIDDEADEDEDDEDEEISDEEDIGYYYPDTFPRFDLSEERADSDDESEMHDSDLDEGPLGEEYTNSSQVLSIIDDSDGDSPRNLAEVYPLDALSNSDHDGDTPRNGPSTKENHMPEFPEDGSYLPKEGYNLDSESVPFSGDARDRRLSTTSERPGVNASFTRSHTPPNQSRRVMSPLPSNNQPPEDAGKEGADVDSISVGSSQLSNESTSKVMNSSEVITSRPETMGLPSPQVQVVDVVDEMNQLSDERETSVMDSREFEVVNQGLLASSPHENAGEDDLPSAADVRNEGETNDNQANSPCRRSPELHELEVPPGYEQPTNKSYSHDVEHGIHPDLQIRTLNEDTTDELVISPGQPEAVLREDGVGSRSGKSLSEESEDVPENNTTASKIKDSESLDEHLSPEQLDSPGHHAEEFISEHQDSNKEDVSMEADFVVPGGDLGSIVRDEADNRDGNPSPRKPMVEIIDLESEDGDYGADEAWVKEEGSSGPTDTNPQHERGPEAESAGDAPDMQSSSPHFFNDGGRSETSFREASISLDNNQEIKPDTLLTLPQTLIPNSDPPVLEDVVEELPAAQLPSRQLPDVNFSSEQSTLTMKYEGLGESEYQPFSSEQLATPRDTQQRGMDVETSPIPSQPVDEQQSLLTPHLTQNTSAPPLPPASPELPPKQTVREKLRAMKSLSAEMARARTNNMSNFVGPWFVQKKESQVTHVSDSENEAASEVDVEAITGEHKIFREAEGHMGEEKAEREEVEDDPAQDDLAQDDLAQDDPPQDDPAQDDPAQDGPAQDDPAQGDPAQGDPAQGDPAQGDPAGEEDVGEQDGEDHYLVEAGHDDSPARLPMSEHVLPTTPATNPRLSTQHPGFRTTFSYFAPLATICNHFNELVDTLVIVLSSTDITLAQGGPRDWNQTISIIDPSSSSCSTYEATTAQIFRRYKQAFPSIRQGDAILLRDFKVQSFQNRLGLLSTHSSAWAVFRKGVDVQMQGPPVEFGAEERGFARGLWDWWGSVGEEVRGGIEESAAEAGDTTCGEKAHEGSAEAEDHDDDDDNVEEIITPTKRGRPKGRRRGQGVVRHELRDGTTYTYSPRRSKGSVHELRDGTTYSDNIEP